MIFLVYGLRGPGLVWIEYDINDERHTFDDGLSEDSDTSTCYEELTDPDVRLRGVEVPLGDEESRDDVQVLISWQLVYCRDP
jgi:hypothetical protein